MIRTGAIAILLGAASLRPLALPADASVLPMVAHLPVTQGADAVDREAHNILAGTMTRLTADQTGWLRRVYFLARQAVFGVAGYDPHGSFLVRFTVASDGHAFGFRLLGYKGRDAEYAAIIDAVSATRFPSPPDGRSRTVTYQATP